MKRRRLLAAALATPALFIAEPASAAYGEVIVRGLTNDQYHNKFLQLREKGLMPVWIDATEMDGENYFSAISRPTTTAWIAKRNMSSSEYQAEFDINARNGYRLTNVRSYRDGDPLYAAIWRKESGPAWRAYHGKSMTNHQNLFDAWTREGWAPVNLSVVHLGSEREVTGLYVLKDAKGLWANQVLSWADVDDEVQQADKWGQHCVHLTSWDTVSSEDAFSAVFWGDAPGSGDTVVVHDVSDYLLDQKIDYYTVQRDYLTRCITGSSSHGGGLNYSAVFRRP